METQNDDISMVSSISINTNVGYETAVENSTNSLYYSFNETLRGDKDITGDGNNVSGGHSSTASGVGDITMNGVNDNSDKNVLQHDNSSQNISKIDHSPKHFSCVVKKPLNIFCSTPSSSVPQIPTSTTTTLSEKNQDQENMSISDSENILDASNDSMKTVINCESLPVTASASAAAAAAVAAAQPIEEIPIIENNIEIDEIKDNDCKSIGVSIDIETFSSEQNDNNHIQTTNDKSPETNFITDNNKQPMLTPAEKVLKKELVDSMLNFLTKNTESMAVDVISVNENKDNQPNHNKISVDITTTTSSNNNSVTTVKNKANIPTSSIATKRSSLSAAFRNKIHLNKITQKRLSSLHSIDEGTPSTLRKTNKITDKINAIQKRMPPSTKNIMRLSEGKRKSIPPRFANRLSIMKEVTNKPIAEPIGTGNEKQVKFDDIKSNDKSNAAATGSLQENKIPPMSSATGAIRKSVIPTAKVTALAAPAPAPKTTATIKTNGTLKSRRVTLSINSPKLSQISRRHTMHTKRRTSIPKLISTTTNGAGITTKRQKSMLPIKVDDKRDLIEQKKLIKQIRKSVSAAAASSSTSSTSSALTSTDSATLTLPPSTSPKQPKRLSLRRKSITRSSAGTTINYRIANKCVTKSIECDICKKCFRLKSSLIAHKKAHHLTAVSDDNNENPIPNQFKCKYCDKIFVVKNAYDTHLIKYCLKIPDNEKKKLFLPLSAPSIIPPMKKTLRNRSTIVSTTRASGIRSSSVSSTSSRSSVSSVKSSSGDEQQQQKHQQPTPSSVKSKSSVKKMNVSSSTLAHSGIYRTPSKKIHCYSCKLTFSDILSFINHSQTHSSFPDDQCK